MILARRFAVVFIAAISLILLFRWRPRDYHSTLQGLSQKVGLGEYIEEDGDDTSPGSSSDRTQQQVAATPSRFEAEHNNGTLNTPLIATSFPPGTLKSTGQNYTRALVTGRLTSEDAPWINSYLTTDPSLTPYIYIVDDPGATLHTPMNKGHEAMYYLTYIIDHYDSLSDINIFMHPHRIAWHTPELLNHDATEVLKRLSNERVTREGYMNLRCHWDPGCPERIYPGRSYRDNSKAEELAVAKAWAEMFPGDPIPEALGAPCCAQFAVSKERILSIPKAKFEKYRNWLIHTSEVDWISGRVFEYFWQKIFANVAKLCPDARVCYCDGYGVCFTTTEVYNQWFEEHHYWRVAVKELEAWDEKAKKLEDVGDWRKARVEEMELEIPMFGRNQELKREIDERHERLVKLRTEALKNGTDPKIRAQVAGRAWKVGDGF